MVTWPEEAVAAMSRPPCSTGRKVIGSVSRTPTVSRRTRCAVGAPNRRVSAIIGEAGKNRRPARTRTLSEAKGPRMVSGHTLFTDRQYSLPCLFNFLCSFVLQSSPYYEVYMPTNQILSLLFFVFFYFSRRRCWLGAAACRIYILNGHKFLLFNIFIVI